MKLCECGCGRETIINYRNEYNRFINGHNGARLGKHHSNESKLKISISRKTKEVQEKTEDTMIQRYGVKHALQSLEIQKKQEDTMINRYGVKCAYQNIDFRNKGQKTLQKNHHVDHPYQLKEIQEKGKQTSINNWGEDHWTKSNQGKQLIEEIWKNRTQEEKDIIKLKREKTSKKIYGSDNWASSSEGKTFHRVKSIKQRELQRENHEPDMPRIGHIERICLNELVQYTPNKIIIRNNHDYAYEVGRYPDGEVDGLPLFIQYNEKEHYIDKYGVMKIENEDTIQTTLDLASTGHIVFNISEYDWMNNQEEVIKNLQYIIKDLEDTN